MLNQRFYFLKIHHIFRFLNIRISKDIPRAIYEEDHVELAKQVMRLHEKGCHVILTRPNHPLVHELYALLKLMLSKTKRHIFIVTVIHAKAKM